MNANIAPPAPRVRPALSQIVCSRCVYHLGVELVRDEPLECDADLPLNAKGEYGVKCARCVRLKHPCVPIDDNLIEAINKAIRMRHARLAGAPVDMEELKRFVASALQIKQNLTRATTAADKKDGGGARDNKRIADAAEGYEPRLPSTPRKLRAYIDRVTPPPGRTQIEEEEAILEALNTAMDELETARAAYRALRDAARAAPGNAPLVRAATEARDARDDAELIMDQAAAAAIAAGVLTDPEAGEEEEEWNGL